MLRYPVVSDEKCEMTAYTFCIGSMAEAIRDNPLADEDIPHERETGNSHDPQAMAINKLIDGTLQVVGQVPRKISSICLIFM